MPICKSCGHEWDWKHTLKKIWKFNSGTECPNCGKKQYVTSKTRQKGAFISPIILLPILLLSFFNIPFAVTTGILIGWAFIFMLGIYPFLMELSNEEEPLF